MTAGRHTSLLGTIPPDRIWALYEISELARSAVIRLDDKKPRDELSIHRSIRLDHEDLVARR